MNTKHKKFVTISLDEFGDILTNIFYDNLQKLNSFANEKIHIDFSSNMIYTKTLKQVNQKMIECVALVEAMIKFHYDNEKNEVTKWILTAIMGGATANL